jgi:flagellar basal body-associated protein FliL
MDSKAVPLQPKSRKKMWIIIILSVLLAIFLFVVAGCVYIFHESMRVL